MIRYLKLLFAKEWNRIWKTKLFNLFFFFDHTFHTHMSTYFQTQDLYQNIHCKQTADSKSNNKIAFMNAWAHLLSIEVVVHQFKVEVWFVYTSIDGLSLSCSRTVNLGRLVKVRQLNATTLKKKRGLLMMNLLVSFLPNCYMVFTKNSTCSQFQLWSEIDSEL